MIDRATRDKIIEAANIVDVVSDFITLKRSGANLKGLCPFHDDRTPSFMVSPAKNICHCFACGEGGSPLNFIMKHEQLSYPDALRYLAKKYGIPIQEREQTEEQKKVQTDRDSMFIVNEWANNWFQKQLYETDEGVAIGLAYFRSRGFRDDILKKFQVGYCPDNRENPMGKIAVAEGYQEKYLINVPDEKDTRQSIGTGLCLKNEESGQLRDRFRNRVIWPIFSQSGRVAGFGGRVLDKATKGVNVKYLNSPESLVYSKRNELFGFFQAKQAISKKDRCYLVEGYTDVMAMHQNGVENVVASSGTALTPGQISIIRRLTNNITVIYDGDSAGIKASERGIDLILAAGMNVKLLLLPDGEDPDSFGRKHSATEFQQYIESHQTDFLHFKSKLLADEAKNDPQAESKMVNSIVKSIANIPDEITRALYIRQAAKNTLLEEKLILDAVNKQVRANLEEQAKERERERRRAAGETVAETGEQPQQEQPVQSLVAETRKSKVHDKRKEALLIQMVIRNGEKRVFCIKDEEGQEQVYSITEFIYYSLQQDDITLDEPLYMKILEEAMEQGQNEKFQASAYFMNHPDAQVAHLAYVMCTDHEQLSKYHEASAPSSNPDDLLAEQVEHLLSDLKLSIVRQQIKELVAQTKNPEILKDKEKYMALLNEFKEKKEVERMLAKICGDRVLG
ncbi:MAG: DNA primase [Bacteroidaceae bacterium]|nr:DNA primase [Bacteroidaceae bacterium]